MSVAHVLGVTGDARMPFLLAAEGVYASDPALTFARAPQKVWHANFLAKLNAEILIVFDVHAVVAQLGKD